MSVVYSGDYRSLIHFHALGLADVPQGMLYVDGLVMCEPSVHARE